MNDNEYIVVDLMPKTCITCKKEKLRMDFPRVSSCNQCKQCLAEKHKQRKMKGPGCMTDYFGKTIKKNKDVKVTWLD